MYSCLWGRQVARRPDFDRLMENRLWETRLEETVKTRFSITRGNGKDRELLENSFKTDFDIYDRSWDLNDQEIKTSERSRNNMITDRLNCDFERLMDRQIWEIKKYSCDHKFVIFCASDLRVINTTNLWSRLYEDQDIGR